MRSIDVAQVCMEAWGALFCVMCAIIIILYRTNIEKRGRTLITALFTNAILLLFDSLAYIYRGNVSTLGWYMTRISNLMVFLLEYAMLSLMATYVYRMIKNRGGDSDFRWVIAIYIGHAFGVLLVLISQFTGIYYAFDATNHYYRNTGWYIGAGIMYLSFTICAYKAVKNRKVLTTGERHSMYLYVFFPMFTTVVQFFIYGISFINLAITLSLLAIYVTYVVHQIYAHADLQRNMLLGQMQPHFVYNSLATIRSLIMEDPELAVESIDHFSSYLRGSVRLMDGQQLIPFETEMELVDNYLYMEKRRFGEKLHIVKSIGIVDFQVPPLSIQTLVENAIRHGIRGRIGPGTLWIRTEEVDGRIHIIIEDDGVGFDVKEIKNQDGLHIGVENTRRRIETTLHGTFSIKSEIGNGTLVEIILPMHTVTKRGDADEVPHRG